MSGNKHYREAVAAISNLFYGPDATIKPKMVLAQLEEEFGIIIPYSTFMKYTSGETCPPPSVIKALYLLTEDHGLKCLLEPKGWRLTREDQIHPTHHDPEAELMDDITAATITATEIRRRTADGFWSEQDRAAALAKIDAQQRDIDETRAAILEIPIGKVEPKQ